jgi:hypothetical protein
VIEKIALFGEGKNLVGVITAPRTPRGPAPELAFVLLNAGVIHHIGPNRLNVKLARRLAAAGFTAMRFDLSGIGDSRASQSTRPFAAQAVADIRAAMDHMQATCGARRFVLVGLCSGADNAHATAHDERVYGLVMLDPYAYPTWRTRMRFRLRGLRTPLWLASHLRRRIGRILAGRRGAGEGKSDEPPAGATSGSTSYERRQPPVADFAAGLQRVLDRGGGVLAAYSGSSLRLINHAGELDEILRPFGLAGRVSCLLWPETNHTFTELSAQTQLLDTILTWAGDLTARQARAASGGRHSCRDVRSQETAR